MTQSDVEISTDALPPTLVPSVRRGTVQAAADSHASGEGRERARHAFVAIVVLFLAAAIFSVIAAGPNTLPGDVAISLAIQDLESPAFDAVAYVGNLIGEGKIAFAAAIALLAYSVFLRLWRDVVFLVLLISLRLATLVLKGIFESPRPTASDIRIEEAFEGFGYPSGHATSATVLGGTLIVLLLRRVHSPRLRVLGVAGCLLIPIVTGFARVYVGAHWPSDVLGGYLWGAYIVVHATDVSNRLITRRQTARSSIRAA